MDVNANRSNLADTLPVQSPTSAFSVSEMNRLVSDALTANFPTTLRVQGEISDFTLAKSGHRYFSLKDNHSAISCALFKAAANRIPREILRDLKSGDEVIIQSTLKVYQPRGTYQLLVSDIEPAGFGALAKAFAALKQKLDQAGYTASSRKRAIPAWANEIAVVTSASGAAIQDVLTTLARRAPFLPVSIYPTLVQGKTAPAKIVSALQSANANPTASVILLVRGGGSLEDLQAFNEESVAMAVVNSRLPVISGVGHETDFTIVDFVSDVRAATPTAAAEWASPDKAALSQSLHKQATQLTQRMRASLSVRQLSLKHLNNRLALQHPRAIVQQQSQRLDELSARLQRIMGNRLMAQQQQLNQWQRQLALTNPRQRMSRAKTQLKAQHGRLHYLVTQRLSWQQQCLNRLQDRLALLSPLGVLNRGYAVVFDENQQLLRDASAVKSGDTVAIRLASGELRATVNTASKS